jgi:adenylate cyclase
MGVEIERKFLLAGDAWCGAVVRSQRLVQGYLTQTTLPGQPCSVRVRIGAQSAWLNIKSAVAGVERREYEYAIPGADAEAILAEFCKRVVEKVRHHVPHGGRTFEIDEFSGDNAGLVVAELELESADAPFDRPPWLGREVSDLPRYYNLNLLHHPYSRWSEAERSSDQTRTDQTRTEPTRPEPLDHAC